MSNDVDNPDSDVIVIGSGMAGSLTAAMLGKKGISTIVVDPHEEYLADFRCEKLDYIQLDMLKKTGLHDELVDESNAVNEIWISRFGKLLNKREYYQFGFQYEDMVNKVRSLIPDGVEKIYATVKDITKNKNGHILKLSDGRTISARLIVMANGLNLKLTNSLGMKREVLSPKHTVCVGFDIAPVDKDKFDFPAMTWWSEKPSTKLSYLSMFPSKGRMRANMFGYWDPKGVEMQILRDDPKRALEKIMPNLKGAIGEFEITDRVRMRPIDLYQTQNHLQPGMVLVGDAYSTSCPAVGTGLDKVFIDVAQLCNDYIPKWLETPGMGKKKIAQFYADSLKVETDTHSVKEAFKLKDISINLGTIWAAKRWLRFFYHAVMGRVNQLKAATNN